MKHKIPAEDYRQAIQHAWRVLAQVNYDDRDIEDLLALAGSKNVTRRSVRAVSDLLNVGVSFEDAAAISDGAVVTVDGIKAVVPRGEVLYTIAGIEQSRLARFIPDNLDIDLMDYLKEKVEFLAEESGHYTGILSTFRLAAWVATHDDVFMVVRGVEGVA